MSIRLKNGSLSTLSLGNNIKMVLVGVAILVATK